MQSNQTDSVEHTMDTPAKSQIPAMKCGDILNGFCLLLFLSFTVAAVFLD